MEARQADSCEAIMKCLEPEGSLHRYQHGLHASGVEPRQEERLELTNKFDACSIRILEEPLLVQSDRWICLETKRRAAEHERRRRSASVAFWVI
jgi:hypothetical protein